MRLGPWAFEVTPASYCIPVYCETTDHASSYRENAAATDSSLNVNHTTQTRSVMIPWMKITPLSSTADELSPEMFTQE
jgi:hypothetical protein